VNFVRPIVLSLAFAAVASPAAAQQLDTLLPDIIPGYDNPFGVALNRRSQPESVTGLSLAGATLAPALTAQAGYDSAPNGAAGSPFGSLAPSLTVTDPEIGLGAFAGFTPQDEFTDTSQNSTSRTIAAGLRTGGASNTLTVAAFTLAAQETGFALNTIPTAKPIAFSVRDVRAEDAITSGPFTLAPALSTTSYSFPGLAADDRTDTRETLTVTYAAGGPGRLVATAHATQSPARDRQLSASTQEALIGLEDTADALWTFRLLAGVARRRARLGGTLIAPVLEASLDWAPTRVDQVRSTLVREVDDPDQLNAAGYRLTGVLLSLRHDAAKAVSLTASARVDSASFFGSTLHETLTSTTAAAHWGLNPSLSLTAAYMFNDRQANALRAANEHVVTLWLTWTP
jgi:hypothetical protein